MKYANEVYPGFVHRDLKPENILVGIDKLPNTDINRLRVTDFGLVKTIANSAEFTTTNNSEELKPNQIQYTRGVGTPLYMAPEQWKGDIIDHRADIYALGCILAEMLTGKHPIDGNKLEEIEQAHLLGSLRFEPKNISKEIIDIVMSCLALKPEDRFASWEDVENKLSAIYYPMIGLQTPESRTDENQVGSDRLAVGNAFCNLGFSYIDIGMPQVAIGYFEKANEIAKEENDQLLEGYSLECLGSAFYNLGKSKRAIEYYEIARNLFQKKEDLAHEGNLLNSMAMGYLALEDLRSALEMNQQAVEIFQKIDNKSQLGSTLNVLGLIFMKAGDLNNAKRYLLDALSFFQKIGNRRAEANAIGNLGLAFEVLGDYHNATKSFESALSIAQETGDLRVERLSLGHLQSVA
jgi:tetratricopeptide (TPR) repeat protein